jgi:hypothetical protein
VILSSCYLAGDIAEIIVYKWFSDNFIILVTAKIDCDAKQTDDPLYGDVLPML